MADNTIITVRGISKTYHSGEVVVRALQNISLTIGQGDFVIITGRNGAGKSTLMHNLAVLDRPDSGQIIMDDHDVTKLTDFQRTELRLNRLGYVFQDYALIAELSALENVMLPAMMIQPVKACRARAAKLLNLVGLDRHARRLPSQLSGGEQQKVAIARALVNDPEIIFADEPTANLDSIAAKDVLNTFTKLNSDHRHTIVMVSHEPEETAYANRVIQLADGKIISDRPSR